MEKAKMSKEIKVRVMNHDLGEFVYYSFMEDSQLKSDFKDENLKDIYEGDIVSLRSVDYKYYCKFENGAFYLYHVTLKDWDGSDLRWGLLSRVYEIIPDMKPTVIGNIYDESNFLKK